MFKTVRFIDLFAGIGGTRIGLESSLRKNGLQGQCVFTSEIKPHAIEAYSNNFPTEEIYGDITTISEKDIPDFDILLAGFPCQPFSSAGARRGFLDTRGTLFFDIERILKYKRPQGFLLENVEGLVTHDRVDRKNPIGRTLETILNRLEELGYKVSWKIIDSSQHGVPQRRKRIYITGALRKHVDLEDIPMKISKVGDVLEKVPARDLYLDSEFARILNSKYQIENLWGKQIKDKRGGPNNIHSWDLGIKGEVSEEQRILLEEILKQRRRKSWASQKGIKWMDGMPLTFDEVMTFSPFVTKETKAYLEDLVTKGYLSKEIPKTAAPDNLALMGYNIIVGKLSFEVSHILHPSGVSPTLVATDVTRLAVADKDGLRRLSVREGLRLFGFPESYSLDTIHYNKAFDLLGNSVCVNVIEEVSDRLIRELSS